MAKIKEEVLVEAPLVETPIEETVEEVLVEAPVKRLDPGHNTRAYRG